LIIKNLLVGDFVLLSSEHFLELESSGRRRKRDDSFSLEGPLDDRVSDLPVNLAINLEETGVISANQGLDKGLSKSLPSGGNELSLFKDLGSDLVDLVGSWWLGLLEERSDLGRLLQRREDLDESLQVVC
jgi:hypothetical protein